MTQPCVKDAESNPAGASYLSGGCTVFFRDFSGNCLHHGCFSRAFCAMIY